MRKIERFEHWLQENGAQVRYDRVLDETNAMYLTDGSSAFIVCEPDISNDKKFALLAHEAGHHFSGLTGDAGRDEEKANRWAASELVDLHKIIQATIDGCQSYYELCEALDLDEDFVKTSIKSYRNRYGDSVKIDHYYLNLYPIWVKDMETGRIWPEE